MIRSIAPDDTEELVSVIIRSGLFRVDDADALRSMLDDYHSQKRASGHRIVTFVQGNSLGGICYAAPREFADRVWELLLIAVDGPLQRTGVGSRLMVAVEKDIQDAEGRLMLIETSSKPEFEPVWQFYRRHGYSEVARIPDYYTDGDDKLSFIKRLGTSG
jgi:ribosomal protein S18 acetylase RimI-like enzyme